MVDKSVLDKLDAGFKRLSEASDCKSLLKKYLTRDVFEKLKNKKTAMGASLLDVIQSGVENLDSGVGLYAPDAESYTLFADLFNPVIEDYHGGFKATDRHPPTDFGDLNTLVNVDPNNEFVISTRVRCGRSLKGYPFNPCLTQAQYQEMEDKVKGQLSSMDGELKGTYFPLTGMDKKTQQQLIDDHFLFKEGDISPGRQCLPLLADRSGHLSQRRQDFPGLGQRRRSLAYHKYAKGRRPEGRLLETRVGH